MSSWRGANVANYTDEQVVEALAKLTLNGGNLRLTARQVGIAPNTLLGWRDKSRRECAEQEIARVEHNLPAHNYGALWGQSQNIALEYAAIVAKRLVEDKDPTRQADNLRALVGFAHLAAQHHLDYQEGRQEQTIINDNRTLEVVYGPGVRP